jgi:hypothetical protein
MLGTTLSIEEICIYYMLIIKSMLYVFWVNCVLSALPNVFLLMKLVSSALPYVLMSSYHRFGKVEHIIYLRLLTI